MTLGARGPRGAAGTSGEGPLYYDESHTDIDIPSGQTASNVAVVQVPAGDYLVTVEGMVWDDGTTGMHGSCHVIAPAVSAAGSVGFTLPPMATTTNESTMVPLSMTGYAYGPGELSVACTADPAEPEDRYPASDPITAQADIIATRVHSIDDQTD